MKKYLLVLVILFSILSSVKSQIAGNSIFDNDILHEIHLGFSESNYWNILIRNYEDAGDSSKIPYLMGDITIDGVTIDSVGVRLKGFTSYGASDIKRPIKIDFNEFVKGKKYDGLKKLNLNNGTGDPSMQRDVICFDLLRNSGVKASRTSFSKVYINNVYWGLYQNIEQIDKTFLKNNFAHGTGNLFKNKGWDTLNWKGNNPNLYHPPYELKTNKDDKNWSGLVNLVDVLNNTSEEEFKDSISKVFNVEVYLKTLAVDVATNNWDSYLEHGRNWYIYEDTVTDIFTWIPWDYNFSLNSTAFGPDTSECLIYADYFYYSKDSITVDFKNQSFSNSEPEWEWDFGDGKKSNEKNPTHIFDTPGKYNVCLNAFLSDSCQSEICKEINTEFKADDCQSIVDGSCPHPANEIFNEVVLFTPSCCEDWTLECEESYKWFYETGKGITGGGFDQNFKVLQKDNERVLIKRLLNVPEFESLYYGEFCNLLDNYLKEDYLFPIIDHNRMLIKDAIKLDTNFMYSYDKFLEDIGAESDTFGIKKIIKKRIDSLKLELTSLYNCPESTSVIGAKDIVINEFVASNDSTSNITDPEGKYEDWIEIFNNTNDDLDLSKVYFSDDFSNLKKWVFPSNTIIKSNDYLIVWADKDVDQEGIHTNFKLKKSGEELILSNYDGSIIDSLTFGEQSTNISSARRPNGTGDFIFQSSTFGFSNNSVGTYEVNDNLDFKITPNPVKNNLFIELNDDTFNSSFKYRIYSTSGSFVLSNIQYNSKFTIDVSKLNNGLYLINIVNSKGDFLSKRFIVNKK